MQLDVWYDLALRALTGGENVANQLVQEAEAAVQPAGIADAEEQAVPA